MQGEVSLGTDPVVSARLSHSMMPEAYSIQGLRWLVLDGDVARAHAAANSLSRSGAKVEVSGLGPHAKRLEALRVVDSLPTDRDAVFFGAWFEIENADSGDTNRYRIVGPDEIDAALGWISIDSPLARALVGKELDAEVLVHSPAGEKLWFIVEIDYP